MVLLESDVPEDFYFPYFGQLLELFYTPKVFILTQQISFSLRSYNKQNYSQLINTIPLCMAALPFAKLLHHFDDDFIRLNEEITRMFQEKKAGSILHLSTSLKRLILEILEHGKQILRIVEEEDLLQDVGNKPRFVSLLREKLCSQLTITLEKDEQRYFKVLGEAIFTSFILDSEPDGIIMAELLSMPAYLGKSFIIERVW